MSGFYPLSKQRLDVLPSLQGYGPLFLYIDLTMPRSQLVCDSIECEISFPLECDIFYILTINFWITQSTFLYKFLYSNSSMSLVDKNKYANEG